MSRFRTYIAMAFAIALVALAGLAAPTVEAAASVHCESTGGGTFACETTAVGARYYWSGGSNATITDNQGQIAYGTCKVGTKPTVTVTAISRASVTGSRSVTVSTGFTCASVAL